MRKKKNSLLLPMILFIGVIAISIGAIALADNLRKAEIENPSEYTSQDEIPRLTANEAYEAVQNEGAVLLDTRSAASFQAQRATGAINIPVDELETRLNELDPNTWYITYCTWPAEETSARAAFILLQNGFTKANPVLGGLQAWVDNGYPITQ